MRKKLLGLFDSDLVYMERFYGFLKDSRIPFNVVAFTDVEALMGQNGKEVPDYLVVSEDYLNKVDNFPGVKIGIFEERNPRGLYRYSPADENLKTLVKLLQISESDYGLGNATSTKFIGVFSPVARTGKTSFSLVLGQLLAKNKKVLYLNLQAGLSVENSFYRVYSEMKNMFGEQSVMTNECGISLRGLQNNVVIENLLRSLAQRTDIDEILEFAEVFSTAKRSGGNLREIIWDTTEAIDSKMEIGIGRIGYRHNGSSSGKDYR